MFVFVFVFLCLYIHICVFVFVEPVSCAPALPSEEHGDGRSQGTPGCENEHFGESESDMLTSNDTFNDLVVAVHPELGSDLTDNHTGQRLVGRRVPQLKKIKSFFFLFLNNNVSQPGREKGEPLDLGQG